ncbi:MAG TPA: AI-2E family transporter [Bacillota bacterium]|nr:AI-2E family transporter [Bacillota bacterium]
MVGKIAWWNDQKTGRLLFLITLLTIGLYILYLLRGLLISFILAVLIVYLIYPLVFAIEKRGTPRVWAILIAYLALFIVVAGIFMYGVPRIVKQLHGLEETIPLYTEQFYEMINSFQLRLTNLGVGESVRQVIDERVSWFEEYMLQLVRGAVDALLGIVGYIFKIILAPVLAFYFLKDIENIHRKVVSIIPAERREDIVELFQEINQILTSYTRGYLLVAAIIGGLTTLAMALLGVDFALMLGIFAGLTELIPYFGPVIGAIPAVSLAVLESKWLALKVVLAFIIIHQLEGSIISPKILGDKVGLHPLVVIVSLLIGGELYGLVGMLLAVPVSAILKVIFKYFIYRFKAADN